MERIMERIVDTERHRWPVYVLLATCFTAVRRIKVRYGWILADGIYLILITIFLCLAGYLHPHNHADLPESERNSQPLTETVNPRNSQDVTVTATPAYNADT